MFTRIKLPTSGGTAAPVAALALLAVAGALVALAAPGGTPSTSAARVTQAPVSGGAASQSLAQQQPPINTGSHIITHAGANTPAPTVAPQPTATDTPPAAPTATPAPPSPTATPTQPPVPSWHTVGSYSGSSSQSLVTLDASYQGSQVRIDWTCTPTQALPTWPIGFTSALTGGGVNCTAGNTGGVMNMGGDDSASDPLAIQDSQGGAWTATVEAWY